MRPNPQTTYAQQRCALTRNLRHRAREAESEARAAIAETQAAREETEAIRAEVDAQLRALRAEMRAERAALTTFIESPEWERGLLTLARDRVRAELLELSAQRKSCGACGSFGRGFYEGLFTDAIAAINREQRLPPLTDPDPINWPVRMGMSTRQGRALGDDWLRPPPPRRRPVQREGW